MSRWIDANEMIKVLAFFLDNMGITLFGRSGKDLASSLVFQADKGKDVVEVIRCGECKYWRAYETWSVCELWAGDPYEAADTNADDFCSYGEREGE